MQPSFVRSSRSNSDRQTMQTHQYCRNDAQDRKEARPLLSGLVVQRESSCIFTSSCHWRRVRHLLRLSSTSWSAFVDVTSNPSLCEALLSGVLAVSPTLPCNRCYVSYS